MGAATSLRAEAACLAEAARVARRSRWYAGVAARVAGTVLLGPGKLRTVRTGFFYLQRIDDLLDGDLEHPDPAAVVTAAKAAWVAGSFDGSRLGRLGCSLHAGLAQLPGAATPGDDPRDTVFGLIGTMERDHARRVAREAWGEPVLRDHHRDTFTASIDLMLRGAHTSIRVGQVPSLVTAMGWCSVVRDWAEDLGRGLCNVPTEVLEVAQLPPRAPQGEDLATLHLQHEVREWWAVERTRAKLQLGHSRAEVAQAAAHDKVAGKLLGAFQESIEEWYERTAEGPPPAVPVA